MVSGANACDECGKKFKVFAKKKRCKHCMDVMCRACVAAHLELKHTDLLRPSAAARRRRSIDLLERLARGDEEEDVQFLSPINARGAEELEYDALAPRGSGGKLGDVMEGDEGVDAVSEDEEDEEEEENDGSYGADRDGEGEAADEELLLGAFSRRASIEEDETQYRELLHMQRAVAAWASKELTIKKQQRVAKRSGSSQRFSAPPGGYSLATFQDSDLFELLFAVVATLAVWLVLALAYAAYLQLRRDVAVVLL